MPKISPAEIVIAAFGGVRATARALHRSPSSISKWRKPRSKKGCGGAVPNALQQHILALSEFRRLKITAKDLIQGRKK